MKKVTRVRSELSLTMRSDGTTHAGTKTLEVVGGPIAYVAKSDFIVASAGWKTAWPLTLMLLVAGPVHIVSTL